MKCLFFVLFVPLLAALALPAASAEKVKCAECGMMVDQSSRFSSKMGQGNQTLYFCDVGDLLIYLKSRKGNAATAQVKDYKSGEWVDAPKAYYVHAAKRFSTPMGWSIAAFQNRSGAEEFGSTDTLDDIMKKLK